MISREDFHKQWLYGGLIMFLCLLLPLFLALGDISIMYLLVLRLYSLLVMIAVETRLFCYFNGKNFVDYLSHSSFANVALDVVTSQFLMILLLVYKFTDNIDFNLTVKSILSIGILKFIDKNVIMNFPLSEFSIMTIIVYGLILNYIPKNLYYYYFFYRKIKRGKFIKIFLLNFLSFTMAFIIPVAFILFINLFRSVSK